VAVLIEALSVIVRVDSILKAFSGDWNAFMAIVPNRTLCSDNEIVRIGFMTPKDVEPFVSKLQSFGLEFLRNDVAIDIVVADQMSGLLSKCSWLEFGHVNINSGKSRISTCRLAGSQIMMVATPEDWKFEESLSSTFSFVPNEHVDKMQFLRYENGLDVYFDPLTGKESYVGRT